MGYSRRKYLGGPPPICHKGPTIPPGPYPYWCGLSGDDPAVIWSISATLPPIPVPPYQEITTRNLAYNVYPNPRNPACIDNLKQLRNRLDLFNGRRVVSIATGPNLIEPETIQRILGPDVNYILTPNDRRLHETAALGTMFRMLRTTATDEATFYAHTKGAGDHHDSFPLKELAIRFWRNRMYRELLDHWTVVREALTNHAAVGCFKIDYSKIPNYKMQSPTGLLWGDWHFAGAFYWFRHDVVFRNPLWSNLPDDPFTCEMWLGSLLPSNQGSSIYQPWTSDVFPTPCLYDPSTHLQPIG